MIFTWLVIAFVMMPLLELTVLLKVNELFGFAHTIALVILTGVTGAWLAKWQGLIVVTQIRADLAEGRMPAPRLMDGVMILIAGILLITPGLITDSIGFALLIPPVRVAIRMWLRDKLEAKLRDGSANVTTFRW